MMLGRILSLRTNEGVRGGGGQPQAEACEGDVLRPASCWYSMAPLPVGVLHQQEHLTCYQAVGQKDQQPAER